MLMKPSFDLLFEGVSTKIDIKSRVARISCTDEIGILADQCTIELDDHDLALEIPEKAARLTVFMGYGTELSKIGTYFVEDVSMSSSGIMRVFGRGFDANKDHKTVKSRLYSGQSLHEVLERVAQDNKISMKIDPNLRSKNTESSGIEQRQESLLHFLTRVSEDYDLTFKVQDDVFLLKERMNARSFSGKDLDVIKINRLDISSWDIQTRTWQAYKSVIAEYSDIGNMDFGRVKVGSGEPSLKIKEAFSSRNEAERRANDQLNRSEKGGFQGSLTFPGNPKFLAETPIQLLGFKKQFEGKKWTVNRAEHQFSKSTFLTSIDLEDR
jgi:phage protein D